MPTQRIKLTVFRRWAKGWKEAASKRTKVLHLERWFFVKNRSIHFHINSTKVIRPLALVVATSVLARYYCHILARTIPSRLTPRKDEKKIKHLTWNSIRLKSVKRTRISNTVESLGYIKYFSSISPRPVKTQAILEDTTVRRALVDREDLKLSLEIGKRPHFLRWAYKRFIYKFFNDFNNQWHLPNIFKYWAQRQDFPTIWKTRCLQTHIEYFS